MRVSLFVFCLIVFMSAYILEAQLITDGLVSYYTMDKKDIEGKTLKDAFGNNHGTIEGEPKSIPGHLGDALEFGGAPDSVVLPKIMKIGENPVTYECWFNKTNTTGWQYLVTNKTKCDDNFFRLGFNNNTGQLRFYTEQDNNVKKAWVTAEDYADGKWHHVVATREKAVGKIYVDGELVKEDVAMAGDLGGDRTNWYLARAEYLIGAMDEVRFYNRALTEEEVKQNFESEGMAVVNSSDKLSITWGMIKEKL